MHWEKILYDWVMILSRFIVESYESIESLMVDLVEDIFFKDVFFQWLLSGSYSMRQIRYFAIQYSYYSRHFPRVLGAAISAMAPQSSWWIPLADNLWDEAGRGEAGQSHEELYRTFLLSVDNEIRLDAIGQPKEPMSNAVSTAITTFLQFFQSATPLQAMAAVGLGSEMFAGQVMGTIGRGLRHDSYNEGHKLNTLFWDVHAIEHEPRHYQLCRDILIQHQTSADLDMMYQVGTSIARSEAMMYRQLHDEMLKGEG